jgi:protein involved in polysaccharide export with SLBB domain
MIKKYTIFLSFISIVLAQISMSDINKLSNRQLDLIRTELQSKAPISDSSAIINIDQVAPQPVKIQSSSSVSTSYFGYNYFKRDINFFDNVPTPSDFKLGPGDEIILSLWGETNSRENFVINKEGLIYYANIGFINLSNKNLKEAELVLVEELSRVYSTLKDKENPTELMLELGKLKSINVYFSGQIETPGINLVHPFSDIFLAIVQAGGVKQEGSLRQVQLIRNGNIVSTVDFYSFFTDGKNNFSSIKIIDGDVIHIPIVSKRVRIQGAITNPGFFELFDDESLADLIQYAGNLEASASSKITLDLLIPISERSSDDNARSSMVVTIDTASNTKLNNGDIASVGSISAVATRVQVLGRVKSPGSYSSSSTLKEVLDMAGGFRDPLYRKSIRSDEIFILRKDENQFYGLEFEISYDESDKFEVVSGDKIFVYEDYKYNNNFTIIVGGQVKKKGTFPLTREMTVGQAINLAEGLTPLGNPEAIIVFQDFVHNDNGIIRTSSKNVSNVTLDLLLNSNASIMVLPYKDMINISGNVYNPGLIAYQQGMTVNRYIKLAGGYRENSLKNKIYLQKANGEINNVVRGRFKRPAAGDTIVVPIDPSPPSEINATALTGDIVSILTNLATIIFIINSNSN